MKQLMNLPKARLWLALVGTATLLIGTFYAMLQQATRQAVNDLPLSSAQTIAQQLEIGQLPKDIVPNLKTNLSDNISPFVIITDTSQHVIASSALLNGQTPLPPIGVFGYTAIHGSDRFTWQPQSGVRLATVVMSYTSGNGDGFIVTGQSLQPAEKRIVIYGELAIAGWLATLAWVSAMLFWPASKSPK